MTWEPWSENKDPKKWQKLMLLYWVEQREAIVEKQLKYIRKLREDKDYFNGL